jgi:hypothetical protein
MGAGCSSGNMKLTHPGEICSIDSQEGLELFEKQYFGIVDLEIFLSNPDLRPYSGLSKYRITCLYIYLLRKKV